MGLARFALMCAAVTLTGATSVQATKPFRWMPDGKWVVRFDENVCMAVRRYSDGKRKIMLGLQATPVWGSMGIVFEVPGGSIPFDIENAQLTIGNVKQPKTRALFAESVKKGFSIVRFQESDDKIAALATSPSLGFSAKGQSYNVPVTSYAAVKKLLDTCEADLLESWGFSKAEQKRVASYPNAEDVYKVFNSRDYPSTAITRGAVGDVSVRGMIGTDGRPKDCVVFKSSGHPDLDQTTCRAFKERAKLKPALDQAGQAMVAPVTLNVRWLMPS